MLFLTECKPGNISSKTALIKYCGETATFIHRIFFCSKSFDPPLHQNFWPSQEKKQPKTNNFWSRLVFVCENRFNRLLFKLPQQCENCQR